MHYLFMLIYTRTRVPVAATVAATVALSTGPLPEAMQRPCWSQARLKHWVGECSMTFGSQWALLGVTLDVFRMILRLKLPTLEEA